MKKLNYRIILKKEEKQRYLHISKTDIKKEFINLKKLNNKYPLLY